MTNSRLLQLPPELQTAVVSCLLHPEDLAHICLVSKQLRGIALPLLYRDVSVNVSDWTETQLENFMARGHPGHRHVKSIEVDSQDLEGECQALKVAKDVLVVLPRNGLRSFKCPLEKGIDNDLVILLAGSQRNLRTIYIGSLRENALNLIGALRPWPPHVESIIVPWKLLSTEDYKFYQELIERSRRRLNALTIRVNNFAWVEDGGDDAQAHEELARGLFGHVKGKCFDRPPLELKDINFQNQDLHAFDRTWYHYIDLTKLRTIQIWNCPGTDHMLRCMINLSKTQPLQLQGLVLSFDDFAHAPLLTEELLRCISGLSYLNLCYVPTLPPGVARQDLDIRCLSGHAETLQDLYLGVGTNNPTSALNTHWTSVSSDIHWLTQRCQNLKQLAVAMPDLEMDDALAGRWGDFHESLEKLATLPRLKVLRLLTWPIDCSPRCYPSRLRQIRWQQHRDKYLKQLDVIADGIARAFGEWRDDHKDRLSVITFGNAERRDQVPTLNFAPLRMDEPVVYKVRRVESEFGMLLETVRTGPGKMRYEEPIAYVFDEDTDQGLSLESYPWGDR